MWFSTGTAATALSPLFQYAGILYPHAHIRTTTTAIHFYNSMPSARSARSYVRKIATPKLSYSVHTRTHTHKQMNCWRTGRPGERTMAVGHNLTASQHIMWYVCFGFWAVAPRMLCARVHARVSPAARRRVLFGDAGAGALCHHHHHFVQQDQRGCSTKAHQTGCVCVCAIWCVAVFQHERS